MHYLSSYSLFILFFNLVLVTLIFPSIYAIYKKSPNLFTIIIFNIISIFWCFYSFYALSNLIILFYFLLWIYLSFLAKAKDKVKKLNKKWIIAFLSTFFPFLNNSLVILSLFFLIYLIYEPILKNLIIEFKTDLNRTEQKTNKLIFLINYFVKNMFFLILIFGILHYFIISVIRDFIAK